MKDIISSARVAIAKAQALIQDQELKLANEKKRMEELKTTRRRVQKELNDQSSELETLRAQLAAKELLSDEELRARTLAAVEVARQRDIQHLREQIQSLAEQE